MPASPITYSRSALAADYRNLWGLLVPGRRPANAPARPNLNRDIDGVIATLLGGRDRYAAVEQATGVPWWFIGLIHALECGGDFAKHPHNGDPLTDRTVHVPESRPVAGQPPFSWAASAADLCALKGWDLPQVRRLPGGAPDWTLPTVLWRAEANNGFGYRAKGIISPYLVAGSSLEQPGRYVRDGVFDPSIWSQQIGFATTLKVLVSRGVVPILDQMADP